MMHIARRAHVFRFVRSFSTVKAPVVVGGSGQLGRHMVKLLQKQSGCQKVTVLDMQPPVAGESSTPVEFQQLTLGKTSVSDIKEAVQGADCVFSMVTADVQHATADALHQTNHKGVQDLVEACQAAGVPRLVHMSSIAVTDHFVPSEDACEKHVLPPLDQYISPYDVSKRLGEEAVLAANGSQFATVSLRAGGILCGPGDFTCRQMLEREGMVIGVAGAQPIDFIYAADVCRAALLAAEKLSNAADAKSQISGQAFFVSKGEAITSLEIGKRIAKKLGRKHYTLPKGALGVIAGVSRGVHRVKVALGQEVPGVSPADFMQIAYVKKTFDNTKVKDALGFVSEYTVDDALELICDEYRNQIG